MSYQLIRGDATSLPLADDSVDLICTSTAHHDTRCGPVERREPQLEGQGVLL